MKLVQTLSWLFHLDGGLERVQALHALNVVRLVEALPYLEVGLPIQGRGVDVADAHRFAGGQDDTVRRDEAVLGHLDDVPGSDLLPRDVHKLGTGAWRCGGGRAGEVLVECGRAVVHLGV